MEGDRTRARSFGQITSGLSQGALALKTIQYVRDRLPAWRDDPDRPHEVIEDKLNAQLCKFLDAHARNDFPMIRFDHEERQIGRRVADVSASLVERMRLEAKPYSIYEPILIIECKRLPAPSPDREREYVTGGTKQCGGIQRFKLRLYARDHKRAALVGYVQDKTLQHWHRAIDSWISELVNGVETDTCQWFPGEEMGALLEDQSTGTAACLSSHSRAAGSEGDRIELHHLWISMAPRARPLSDDAQDARQ